MTALSTPPHAGWLRVMKQGGGGGGLEEKEYKISRVPSLGLHFSCMYL